MPLVKDEEKLVFDVLRAKMSVITDDKGVSSNSIIKGISTVGMKAEVWEESQKNQNAKGKLDKFKVLTGLSALFVATGFIIHTFSSSFLNALISSEEPLSWYIILPYSLAILTGGWNIAPKAWYALKNLRPDMNLLMTIAVIGAVILGEWFEAASVTFLFCLALYLESWSVSRARNAIESLMNLSPEKANVIDPETNSSTSVLVEDVLINSHVSVRPGERFPLDGTIISGESSVNQSPITGESVPVDKKTGDDVYAGTINGDGHVVFKTTSLSDDTTIARIIRLVEDAQSHRAESERWIDKFARIYTPGMLGLALLIFTIPSLFLGGNWLTWGYRALVFLVIGCPCALVISIPVSIVAGIASAAIKGVLIKGGVYLELPSRLKAFAFDKTGTLTTGKPQVQKLLPLNGTDENELLKLAAQVEAGNIHPFAEALINEAENRSLEINVAESVRIVPGKGAEGIITGSLIKVGSVKWLQSEQEDQFNQIADSVARFEQEGHSLIAVWNENNIMGLIGLKDTVRPEAEGAISDLKTAGIEHLVLLSGDRSNITRQIGIKAGFDEIYPELLPEEKQEKVKQLKTTYDGISMVGDGINDAPAMAASSLGIAMGAMGTDTAIETSDIALMTDDLSRIPWLILHSRRTLNIIAENITIALGLKLVFMVLAAMGYATLWMAIMADMGASLIVIFNSLRLLKS